MDANDNDDVIDVSAHEMYYYNEEADLANIPRGSAGTRPFRESTSAAAASATSTSQASHSDSPYAMRFCKVPSRHRLGGRDHSTRSPSETFSIPSPRMASETFAIPSPRIAIRNSLRDILDTSRAAAMASSSTNFLTMSPSSTVRAFTMAAREAHKRRNASPSPSPTKRVREHVPRMYSVGELGRNRSSSVTSPTTSNGRSSITYERAKQIRETLRSAVLDDDLRRSVRNLEEERLELRAKLNEYKRRADRTEQMKSHLSESNGRMARELDKERRDKDRLVFEHKMQVAELKRQLDAANEKASKSEMDRVLAESQFLERSSNEGLFQDMLNGYKELIENSLQCSVCSEVLIFASTVSCGHTFCEDCLEQWKRKATIARPNCPICRAEIRGQVSNIVLDNHIDKAVENFFPDDARRQRQELVEERRRKKEEREVTAAPPRRVRRTMSDLDTSTTESDEEPFPWSPTDGHYNDIHAAPRRASSPALVSSAGSSILSRASTSFALSPTPSSTRNLAMRPAPIRIISDDEEEEIDVGVSYIIPSSAEGHHLGDTTDDEDDFTFARATYLTHAAQDEDQPNTDEDEFGNLSSDAED